MAISPDGTQIASASADNTVRIWDAATGTLLRTLTGHTDAVYSVTFSPDGWQIISGGADDTVRIWALTCAPGQFLNATGQCSLCPPGSYSPVTGATLNETCNACPENTFSFVAAATSFTTCIPCPTGSYSSPGATFCNAPPIIHTCPTNPVLLLRSSVFLLPASLVNGNATDDRGNVTQQIIARTSGTDFLKTSASAGIHSVSWVVTDRDGSSNLNLSTGAPNPARRECLFEVSALPLTSNFTGGAPRFTVQQGTLFRIDILQRQYIPVDRLLFQLASGSLPLGVALGQTTGELVGQPLESQLPTNVTVRVCDTHLLANPLPFKVLLSPAQIGLSQDRATEAPSAIGSTISPIPEASTSFPCIAAGSSPVQPVCPNGECCAAGTFHNGTTCAACSRGGFYQDLVGAFGEFSHCGCKRCNNGTYVTLGGGVSPASCVVCPEGTVTKLTAGYRACHCQEGYSRTDRFGPCEPCEGRGLLCEKDTRTLRPGYWWTFASSVERNAFAAFNEDLLREHDYALARFEGRIPVPYRCPRPESCQGGLQGSCAAGYDGTLCATCADGYFRQSEACYKCPEKTASVIVLLIVLCVLVGGLWYILSKNAKDAARLPTEPEEDKEKKDGCFSRMAARLSAAVSSCCSCFRKTGTSKEQSSTDPGISFSSYLTAFMTLVSFVQVVSSMTSAYSSVTWPPSYSSASSALSVVVINPFTLTAPSCVGSMFEMDAFDNLIGVLAVVVSFVVLCTLYYFLRRGCLAGRRRRDLLVGCIRNASFVVFLLYPSICNAAFKALASCETVCPYANSPPIECASYLTTDYSIECGTSRYSAFRVLAIVAVALIGFGLPLAVGLYIRYHRDSFRLYLTQPAEWVQKTEGKDSKVVCIKAFVAQIESYPGFIYWEFMDLVRKLLVT